MKRCKEMVYSRGSYGHHRCSRPAGHGPGEAYCKQHDPDVREAKRAERDARWREQWSQQERDSAFTKRARQAIRDIAAGHNDPRFLAIEILKEYEG